MRFELSQEIMDQIIFGMEDQGADFCFDSAELQLIAETDAQAIAEEQGTDSEKAESIYEERFLALPDWQSVDGFNLMEGFVVSLRNPMQRESLRQILQSGRGVFRQFKDALKEHKEIERLWFRFKQREMRKRVLDWYNDLRELWGLEPLSRDEEFETTDLLLSDFLFESTGSELSPLISGWDRRLFGEMFPSASPEECDFLYGLKRCGIPAPASVPGSVVIRSCSPLGELAGFLWAHEYTVSGSGGSQDWARIIQLGVEPEFRGLGMAMALLNHYQKIAAERGVKHFLIDIPASAEFISRSCERNGFQQHSVLWEMKMNDFE